MSKPEIIIIGAGGHARSCIEVIEQQGQYKIAGLVGLPEQRHSKQLGYVVVASDDALDELAKSYHYAFIAIGHVKTAEPRIRLYHHAKEYGFQFPAIIAPTAYVSRHAVIGAGSIVMHGAVVNAGARVGDNCIINTRALIEHDTNIDDHCHIATGSILNGDVTVYSGSFIGSGSTVKEGVLIGKGCLVGMGLTVRHRLADYTCYTGRAET
jgi:sugar O-acyltransferase (sialic acid O-acetyltransferase NeuD family)